MKIWLLENGERTGPYETFAVRDRIASGELNAETAAWYEDAPGWVTLGDVPSLTGLFVAGKQQAEEPEHGGYESVDEEEQVWMELPPLHPVQRFFARFFDLTIYLNIVWMIRAKNGDNPFKPVEDPLLLLAYYLPYILLDALLMHYIGTTPGKKLLGVEVRSANGMLGLVESLVRSLRVWVLGFGMFLITPISLAVSWFMGQRLGRFLWDVPKQYVVMVEPVKPSRLWLYIGLILLMSFIVNGVIPDEMKPQSISDMLEMMGKKKD